MPKIIANVKVDAKVNEEIYAPFIEKLTGTYPVTDKHKVLLVEKPFVGLRTLEANVNDTGTNIGYLLGTDKGIIREDVWPHNTVRQVYVESIGYASLSKEYKDLGLALGYSLDFCSEKGPLSKKEREDLKEIIIKKTRQKITRATI